MKKPQDLFPDYLDIFDRFIVEASFLWVLRSLSVNQPHYDVDDIRALENRIQANLDGLMTSTDTAWSLCEKAMELNGPGETFTAAIVAFKSGDISKINRVIDAGLETPVATKGLISAIAWLPPALRQPWIHAFLASKDTQQNYLAICLCSLLRQNPGDFLNQYLLRDAGLQHEKLHARCLRLAGEMKRHDVLPSVIRAIHSDSEHIAFWANWAALLLGNKDNIKKLEPYVFNTCDEQARALNIVFRVLTVHPAREWVSRLAVDRQQTRAAIKAAGIVGDPLAVDGLIEKMTDATQARVAGEAFSLITGIDLEQSRLSLDSPLQPAQVPSEDVNDPIVTLDEDEHLPWPNATLIAARWQQSAPQWVKGQRYFLGKEINTDNLSPILQHGFQRQRQAATMELALLDSSRVLQNTCAKVS